MTLVRIKSKMINIYKIFSYKSLVFAKNEEDNISLDKNKDKKECSDCANEVFRVQDSKASIQSGPKSNE